MAKKFWRESMYRNGVTYEYETIEEYGYVNGKYSRLNLEKTGQVRVKVGDNYGNCLYTSCKGGNMIYLAMKNETPVPNNSRGHETFELLAKMREVLDKAGIEYRIACC